MNKLMDAALAARDNAHAPFSKFKVGAAIEDETGRILGAHVVGPHADEIINIFGLAIRNGLTADQIKQTIFAYPTSASDVGYML